MSKQFNPVAPSGMEIMFYYTCPNCKETIELASPVQPAMVQCFFCYEVFPILPVDERSIQYIKLMLGNGLSAVDLDYY